MPRCAKKKKLASLYTMLDAPEEEWNTFITSRYPQARQEFVVGRPGGTTFNSPVISTIRSNSRYQIRMNERGEMYIYSEDMPNLWFESTPSRSDEAPQSLTIERETTEE